MISAMNTFTQTAMELPPPRFRTKWFILVLAAIILLAIVCFERYESYTNTESHEMARLQTLARVIDTNLGLHLKAIDGVLLAIRDKQAVLGLTPAGIPQTVPSSDELRVLVETTPGVRTLAIADTKGNYLASNRPELVGRIIAERPAFQAAQKIRDTKTLVVSEPFITLLNVWGLHLARPIIGRSGEFLGAVVLTLDPEFFKSMLSSVLYAEDLRCLLMHEDGVVFQAVGEFNAKLGTNLAKPGSLLMSHLASGQTETSLVQTSYSTGDRRIAVLRNSGLEGMDKHFVISFSRNFDEVFATWRRETLFFGLGYLAFLFLSAALLAVYQRHQVTVYRDRHALLRERNAVEEARQQSLREIEDLYNNAPCGYHSLDASGTILRMNQTELDWLGLKREDVEGKLKFFELLDEAGQEIFHKNYTVFMKTGLLKDLEFNLHRPDGRTLTVLVTTTFFCDDEGRYVSSRTTLTDITERKSVEVALKTSEAKMRGLFELSPLGIALTDMQGRYIEFNDAFQNICGYTQDELNAMDYWELTPRIYEAEEQRQLVSLAETGRYGPYEKEYRRKDGSLIPLCLNGMLITGSDGKQYIWSLIEDITERKMAEQELERHRHHLEELVDQRTRALEVAKDQAESANRAKSLFLGNMSHEMRTPIHQISGVAGLLRKGPLTDKQNHYLSLLDAAANRLNTVVGGILTLVDLESGSKAVSYVPINPNRVIQDVVTMVSDRATQKGLRMEFEESPLPDHLLGDANNIQTIAACYINNAITFSERGSIQVRLVCASEEAGSVRVRLEVKDDGIGIAQENIERLFEHFEQADNSHTRKYAGTGVGLAIVRKLARLMGGDAGCESSLGIGSTFWATFVMVKDVGDSGGGLVVQGDYVI